MSGFPARPTAAPWKPAARRLGDQIFEKRTPADIKQRLRRGAGRIAKTAADAANENDELGYQVLHSTWPRLRRGFPALRPFVEKSDCAGLAAGFGEDRDQPEAIFRVGEKHQEAAAAGSGNFSGPGAGAESRDIEHPVHRVVRDARGGRFLPPRTGQNPRRLTNFALERRQLHLDGVLLELVHVKQRALVQRLQSLDLFLDDRVGMSRLSGETDHERQFKLVQVVPPHPQGITITGLSAGLHEIQSAEGGGILILPPSRQTEIDALDFEREARHVVGAERQVQGRSECLDHRNDQSRRRTKAEAARNLDDRRDGQRKRNPREVAHDALVDGPMQHQPFVERERQFVRAPPRCRHRARETPTRRDCSDRCARKRSGRSLH